MTQQNPDLLAVSKTLNALARQIHQKKAATNDPDVYSALNKELMEVNHRITMIGGLIFADRAADIASAAKKVEASKDQISEEVKKIEKLNNFINAISAFLGLVDKVIDIAKKV